MEWRRGSGRKGNEAGRDAAVDLACNAGRDSASFTTCFKVRRPNEWMYGRECLVLGGSLRHLAVKHLHLFPLNCAPNSVSRAVVYSIDFVYYRTSVHLFRQFSTFLCVILITWFGRCCQCCQTGLERQLALKIPRVLAVVTWYTPMVLDWLRLLAASIAVHLKAKRTMKHSLIVSLFCLVVYIWRARGMVTDLVFVRLCLYLAWLVFAFTLCYFGCGLLLGVREFRAVGSPFYLFLFLFVELRYRQRLCFASWINSALTSATSCRLIRRTRQSWFRRTRPVLIGLKWTVGLTGSCQLWAAAYRDRLKGALPSRFCWQPLCSTTTKTIYILNYVSD